MRPSGRASDQRRIVQFIPHVSAYAEGSCLVHFGQTKVLCTASVAPDIPRWLKGKGKGWVSAEYGMLPRSTHSRMARESARGKQTGRTQEIQRLIGRSLRAVTDLEALGERQILIDCDVLQADGGTRTAAITGAYVALAFAVQHLIREGQLTSSPLKEAVGAISCGLFEGQEVLDLDYDEDSAAQADANFVLSASKRIVEIQGTAEESPFTRKEFNGLLDLAEKGVLELITLQEKVLETGEPVKG